MDQAQVMKREREDWERLYHKTLKGIKAMIDVQRAVKDMKKLVEEVWKHRKRGQGTQYLVHWKGYGDEHDQWIAETGLPHAKQAVEDYWMRHSRRIL